MLKLLEVRFECNFHNEKKSTLQHSSWASIASAFYTKIQTKGGLSAFRK